MAVPLGLMTGAEVGIVEKKQGRFTFPDRDPVTGLIIDNALEAERQNTEGLNAVSVHIQSFTNRFLFYILNYIYFLSHKYIYYLLSS